MKIDPNRNYRVLDPQSSYSFAEFFKFPYDAEDILADLDFQLERRVLKFHTRPIAPDRLQSLKQYIQENIELTEPVAEISRREFLIAPIIREIGMITHSRIRSEYTIHVNQWLKGSFDYYIQNQNGLVVIEAKQSDLVRGFVQLAAELIALDAKTESTAEILTGAVTSGEL
jgi:hypothetical protein